MEDPYCTAIFFYSLLLFVGALGMYAYIIYLSGKDNDKP